MKKYKFCQPIINKSIISNEEIPKPAPSEIYAVAMCSKLS